MGEAEADLKRQQEALASLRPAAAGSTQSGGASSAQLAALDKRVKALEDSLAALKSAPPSPIGGNADNAVLSQALADLKAKLAGGAPYEAEAGTIDRLVPGIPGLGRLRPYAHSGLPTVESLAHELERIAAGFPLTEPQAGTGDGSYWDSISRWLGSIVTVRMIGAADWKAISTQAAADAKAGRLAEAVTRLADSETALPPELAQWREKAKARLGADAMVEEVSAAVLRVLSSGKS